MKTLNDVLEIVTTLRDSEQVNPVTDSDGSACLYTDPQDTNRHCIAGHVLTELGLGDLLPPVGDEQIHLTDSGRRGYPSVSQLPGVDDHLTSEAIKALCILQAEADGMNRDYDDVSPVPWGEAIEAVWADLL